MLKLIVKWVAPPRFNNGSKLFPFLLPVLKQYTSRFYLFSRFLLFLPFAITHYRPVDFNILCCACILVRTSIQKTRCNSFYLSSDSFIWLVKWPVHCIIDCSSVHCIIDCSSTLFSNSPVVAWHVVNIRKISWNASLLAQSFHTLRWLYSVYSMRMIAAYLQLDYWLAVGKRNH